MVGAPPSGTVTFLFTDIEGSTSLWNEHPDLMAVAVARHDEMVRDAIELGGGYVFTTAGDSFAAAFRSAADAAATADSIRRSMENEPWPESTVIRVRVGLHTGEATERSGDYFGRAVNLAARISDAAHGGQVVASRLTADLARAGIDRELGFHVLKGFDDPVEIVQLGPGDHPELRTRRAFRVTLPDRRTSLLGRRDELADIARLVADHRLVTVTGSGGVGKTSVAVEVARWWSSGHGDGAHFVDLAPVTDDASIDRAIAAGIGLVPIDSQPIAEQVHHRIAESSPLLVVDNCEHLVDAVADRLDQLLLSCPGVRVVATSREALDIEGEHVVRLRPLAFEAGTSPAVNLFFDRARSAGAVLASDDVTTEAARRICERLDGLPLAIELAAARTTSLTIGQVLDRLDDRFGLLTAGRRRTRGRQQTLETAIAWSFDLLTEEEGELLRCLAVFPATFDLTGAAAVADLPSSVVLRLVDSLVAKSLIHADAAEAGSEARYRLLESIRVYAWDQLLATEGGTRGTLGRYVRLVADSIDTPDADPYGFGPLRPWMDDIRPAIDAAVDLGLHRELARITSWTFPFWATTGRLDEGTETLRGVVGVVDGDLRARNLDALSHVQYLRARQRSGRAYAHEALATDTGGAPLGHTLAHLNLAENLWADGAIEDSDLHLLRASADVPGCPNSNGMRRYLHYQLGKRAIAGGDPRSALADFRLALGDHSLLAPLAAAGELVALLLLDDRDALGTHLTDPEHAARRAAFRRRARDGEMQAAGVEVASLIGDDRLDPGAGRRGLAALYDRKVAGLDRHPTLGEIAVGLAAIAERRGDTATIVALLADTFIRVPCGPLELLGYQLYGETQGWPDSERPVRSAHELNGRTDAVRSTQDGVALMEQRARTAIEAELARNVDTG